MTTMPAGIGDIKILGSWINGFRVTLIVIPFEVWAFISDRLAYEYMGPYVGEFELDPKIAALVE